MVRLQSPQDSPSGSYDFEPGVYKGTFVSYDGPKPSPKFANSEIIILEYESEDMDFSGNLNALYSYSMKDGGPLHKAISAIAGHTIAADEEIDLDDLIGTEIMLTISENKKTGKNGQEMSFPKIDSVSPIRARKTRPAPKPAPVVEEDDDEEDDMNEASLDGTPFQRSR